MLGVMKRRPGTVTAMLCAALTLGGCTFSDSLKPEDIRSAWALPAPVAQDIFFTTDREPDGSKLGYGLRWDARTHCGAVQLSIPAAGGNPAAAEPPRALDCDGAAAMDGLAAAIAAAAKGCNRVLVVVHGYNTVFRTGLLRAGQVATDTQWRCATLLFSWSSAGKFDRYAADIERSGYSVPMLIAVLRALRKAGLETDIFAHSMGARVALSAAAALCSETPGGSPMRWCCRHPMSGRNRAMTISAISCSGRAPACDVSRSMPRTTTWRWSRRRRCMAGFRAPDARRNWTCSMPAALSATSWTWWIPPRRRAIPMATAITRCPTS
jgi:pimeloyl-ACP methyl ester carboxylesterase